MRRRRKYSWTEPWWKKVLKGIFVVFVAIFVAFGIYYYHNAQIMAARNYAKSQGYYNLTYHRFYTESDDDEVYVFSGYYNDKYVSKINVEYDGVFLGWEIDQNSWFDD